MCLSPNLPHFQDGNDFFDIAADRYRCFDPLKVDCNSRAIMIALSIIVSGVIVMVGVHVVFAGYKEFKGRPECEDILERKQDIKGDD